MRVRIVVVSAYLPGGLVLFGHLNYFLIHQNYRGIPQ